jgi:hypothetical protein
VLAGSAKGVRAGVATDSLTRMLAGEEAIMSVWAPASNPTIDASDLCSDIIASCDTLDYSPRQGLAWPSLEPHGQPSPRNSAFLHDRGFPVE